MDHSHHHEHMNHHSMDNGSSDVNSIFNTLPATTAATILQAVMTTMMAQDSPHKHHHSAMETTHDSHSSSFNAIGDHSSHTADVHSAHVSSGGHGDMPMHFHFGIDTVILFKEWTTTTTEGLIGSVIGIFILAMLYEGIKFFREFLFKKYFTSLEYSSVSVLGDDGKPVTEVHKVARNRMFSWPHMLQTLMHVVQMVLSYFLMLIFMTYNVWLCLAVVAGAGVGYFLFGWRKATVVDITEHCH
ncbi:high affinity copper uptake protein 1-like [Uloborus diversus]|uniref:high affinity copper uptake protein 1-like n=1 Tax=Uloborus diversus TaxID=327109 RepID=UPI00240A4AC7|nr:high affinity copper uptake protein 1-like [Uloborus diversus]XP_054722817.1 high affinity copper uptake protein 1-like [Uloborus diversus]